MFTSWSSIRCCFIYFNPVLLGMYVFIIVISPCTILPFSIIYPVIILKNILCISVLPEGVTQGLVSVSPNSEFIQDRKLVVIVQIYYKMGELPKGNWDKILWLRHTIDLQSGRKGWRNSSFWKSGQQNTPVQLEEFRKPRARYMLKNSWEDSKFITQADF